MTVFSSEEKYLLIDMKNKSPIQRGVVIIGAGAAGLSAARTLLEKSKIKVTIVEASDYVGGRIKACPNFIGHGHKVDLGAEYIHGLNTMLTKFIEDQQLHSLMGEKTNKYMKFMEPIFITSQGDGGPDEEPTPEGMYGGYYLGKENLLLRFDSIDPDFVKLNKSLWEMFEDETPILDVNGKNGHDSSNTHEEKNCQEPIKSYPDNLNLSLRDYLEYKNVPKRMYSLAVAGYANTAGCAHLEDLSFAATRSFERYWKQNETEGDVRLHSSISMGAIIDALVKNITSTENKATILLDWKVASIQYSSSSSHQQHSKRSVVITSQNDDKINADACIITVPISIINQNQIIFQPPLPKEKINAFAMVGMEGALKIMLKFKRKIWPEKLQSIVCADCPIPEIWFREFTIHVNNDLRKSDEKNNEKESCFVAVCYLMSKAADDLLANGEIKAIEIAKNQLQQIFRVSSDEMNETFLSSMLFDWKKHDSIRGGYGYPKVGIQPKHYKEMAANVNNELFFAGEGTHLGACMTVQAAMETGCRAADEVLDAISEKCK